MKVLDQDEFQRFLIQVQYYELFLLNLAAGLHCDELLALQQDDWECKTSVLNINKQVYPVNGGLRFREPHKHMRFHDLRYTFTTLAIQGGRDIKTLSAILGYVSLATMLNLYPYH